MSTGLLRRVDRLEATRRAERAQRWKDGKEALFGSMEPAHRDIFRDWMFEHCGGFRPDTRPGDTTYTLLQRCRPPALVRAVWLLMAEHMERGTPVSLAPPVAEVYLVDPDAFPANGCEGCGYLMPTRSTITPDGAYRHSAWYLGACPVCGRDHHEESEASDDHVADPTPGST